MAIRKNVTEIPDSEDEPMTSSPVVISDEAVNKLCAVARVPAQEAQDGAFPRQASAEHVAKSTSGRTDGLGIDQGNAFVDVEASQIDQTDVQRNVRLQQEGTTVEARNDHVKTQGEEGASQLLSTTVLDDDNALKGGRTKNSVEHIDHSSEHDHLSDASSISAEEIHEEPLALQSFQESFADEGTATGVHDDMTDSSHAQAQRNDDVGVREDKLTTDLVSEPTGAARPISSPHIPGLTEPMGGVTANVGDLRVIDEMTSTAVDSPTPEVKYTTVQKVDNTAFSVSTHKCDDQMPQNLSERNPLATSTLEPPSAGIEHEADTEQAEKIENELSNSYGGPDSTVETTVQEHPSKETDDTRDAEQDTAVGGMKMDVDAHEIGVEGEGQSANVRDTPPSTESDEIVHLFSAKRFFEAGEEKATQANKQQVGGSPATTTEISVTTESRIETGTPSASTGSEPQAQSALPQNSTGALTNPARKRTPQEITLAELKAQKATLLSSLATLPAIQVLIEENEVSNMDTSDNDEEPTDADIMAAANRIVKEHIKLLHEYNELKDMGQGLMGLIADQRGVRIVDVQDEFEIDAKD